jgi:hypothetical protein
MAEEIDGKYRVNGGGSIVKENGDPLPQDEPRMLFRGKDKLLPQLLEHYKQLCQEAGSPSEQIEGIQERLNIIKDWQSKNPDKVKVPD